MFEQIDWDLVQKVVAIAGTILTPTALVAWLTVRSKVRKAKMENENLKTDLGKNNIELLDKFQNTYDSMLDDMRDNMEYKDQRLKELRESYDKKIKEFDEMLSKFNLSEARKQELKLMVDELMSDKRNMIQVFADVESQLIRIKSHLNITMDRYKVTNSKDTRGGLSNISRDPGRRPIRTLWEYGPSDMASLNGGHTLV